MDRFARDFLPNVKKLEIINHQWSKSKCTCWLLQSCANTTSNRRNTKHVMFHGVMHDNIIMRKDKKNFTAACSFWPEACFWDFFGMKKAEGL